MTSRSLTRRAARLVPPVALAGALGLAAAACARAPEPTTHTVTMEGLKFQPEVLKLRAGDTVVWVNQDMFPHTATSAAGALDSGPIAAGGSWTYKVNLEGDLSYVCTYHPAMRGSLVLE